MPNDDKVTAHIDSAEQSPTVPEDCPTHCPKCGADGTQFEGGYGLAGGGIGVYMFCSACGTIVSKTQIQE